MTALLPDLAFLPKFDTVEEERLHRKQRLAASFRLFGKFGFDEGVAGHITVRDPEHADRFWVNPFGMNFKHIRVSDLICVDHTGAVVEGDARVNRAAFAIHSQVHAARPDVIAAAHSHSLHGKAWSSLGRLLDPITQDACAFFEDHALFDDFTGVVLDLEEGKRIGAALGDNKAVILRNHGLLTVGHSRRRRGVVVHHDGPLVPGAAPRGGRRHAGADPARHGPQDVQAGRLAGRRATCRSSPSGT